MQTVQSAHDGRSIEEKNMDQKNSFEYEGPPDLKVVVERALRWVQHPLLGLNVLDAGLVHAVRVHEQCVRVSLAMTSPGCRLGKVVIEDIEAELFDHLGGRRRVEVAVANGPAWTPARMKVVPIDRRIPCQRQGGLIRVNMPGSRPT
jgi:metal-sulfur cluster biosynthetic enzyme